MNHLPPCRSSDGSGGRPGRLRDRRHGTEHPHPLGAGGGRHGQARRDIGGDSPPRTGVLPADERSVLTRAGVIGPQVAIRANQLMSTIGSIRRVPLPVGAGASAFRLQDLLRQHRVRPPEASSGQRPRLSSDGAAGAASALGNEADRLPGPPGSRDFRSTWRRDTGFRPDPGWPAPRLSDGRA